MNVKLFFLFRLILVKEKRLPDMDGKTTVEITVFSVTHLDVRNVFLQNLPEEISDHCFLIDIVPECNKGESETLALLRCSEGEDMLLFKPNIKEVRVYTKREGVPQALNCPNSGITGWKWSVCMRGVCVYMDIVCKYCCGVYPHTEISLRREALDPW